MDKKFSKLSKGDKVAIVSPSFAAPGRFSDVYKLGLERLRTVFGLLPVEYPTTAKLGASGDERAADLIAAFNDPEIKAVIATIGGDDQVTYIKNLPAELTGRFRIPRQSLTLLHASDDHELDPFYEEIKYLDLSSTFSIHTILCMNDQKEESYQKLRQHLKENPNTIIISVGEN